jgi:SAM-dependent methyltransferase
VTVLESGKEILGSVAEYYSGKISTHGVAPAGVDWNSKEGQDLRFLQLCRILDNASEFSVNDLGCGYGALVDYFDATGSAFRYLGLDVSEAMVREASKRFAGRINVRFEVGFVPSVVAEYGIASGIFNVRLDHSDEAWMRYVLETLDVLNDTSTKGFSFNCLTAYSDKDKMRKDLFYADPSWLFDHCKRRFSKNVALLHDYDLYEFTILVRK